MAADVQMEPNLSGSKADHGDLLTIWNGYVPLIGDNAIGAGSDRRPTGLYWNRRRGCGRWRWDDRTRYGRRGRGQATWVRIRARRQEQGKEDDDGHEGARGRARCFSRHHYVEQGELIGVVTACA